MIDLALKNILRQKSRTIITLVGIAIGIAAIVSLGSISAGLRVMVSEQLEQVSGQITVYEKSDAMFFQAISESRISESVVDEIEAIDGVKETAPIIMEIGYLPGTTGFGQPDIYYGGVEPEKEKLYTTGIVDYEEGEGLEEGDLDVVIIGSNIAEIMDIGVGDTIDVKGTELDVKGIYEESGDSGIDSGILMPLETIKEIFEREDYSMIMVYPEDVKDAEDIANAIQDSIDDVSALTTEELAKQIGEIIDQIQFFTLGIAGISAIVGGLGVMNTMIMSIMERRREIGIMKAIGATERYIIIQIITESIIIAFIGGVIGVILGASGSIGLRALSQGLAAAKVTPGLIGWSLGFAILLGLVGGLYPAWKASKLDPVQTLRYE